jgi:hypothetical protein
MGVCRKAAWRSAHCMKWPAAAMTRSTGCRCALRRWDRGANEGAVLWCVTRQDLFAPVLAQAGLAQDRVIYVEAGDEKSVLACFEEALRHHKLGAVVAEVSRLSMTASRRLQLAAEDSGVTAGRALARFWGA